MIGAIALVMLLVVFVPMVLDSEPRPAGKEPSAVIPPRDNAPPLPPPAPAPKVVAAQPSAATVTPKAAELKAAEPAPVKPPELKVVSPQPPARMLPPPAAAPDTASVAPAKLEGFAVQVGAFRDEAKLKQLREKLADANVVHYTERLESKAGPLTRLRAGPFATRDEAEAALVKLKRAAVDGKVVPLQ
ncbi:MAG: SPOR domain-containing protein [Usitatibacter sp.]